MAGETAVEQPAAPAENVVEEKKEIVEAETKEEKKDEEKKEEAKEEKEKKEKPKKVKPPPPPPVHKKDFKEDIVYMYQFSRTPKLPSISPYCIKLETYLKLQEIPYENVEHQSKLRSKKGMLPFIELNGEEINDSENVIKFLSEKLDKGLDTGMIPEHSTVQHAMVTMIENHLSWCFTNWYARNIENLIKGYNLNLKAMLHSKMPTPLLTFVMKHTYMRTTIKKMKMAGFGQYTDAEVEEMGKKDLRVLSELLGEKQFFFGDDLRSLDLKAFVYLSMMLNVDKEVPCPLRDFVEEECKNLVGVYNRVKDRAWGDHWDEATGEQMELNPHIAKPEPEPEAEKEEKKEEEKKEDKKEVEAKKDNEEKEKAEEKDKEEKEQDNKEEKK